MKTNRNGKSGVCCAVLLAIIAAAVLCGCPEPETGEQDLPPLWKTCTVKMTKPWDPFDPDEDPWEIREQIRVIHTLWHEPIEDPRIVIGYQHEDGTPYFDHIVLMYGLRLRYRDCAPDAFVHCIKYGLHACNSSVYYINDYFKYYWEMYFKPVRARGIKVLLAIVPNSDGVGVGNLFESASWTEALQEQYGDYPFNPHETYRMIDEVAQLMKDYQIDGIAFDENYIGAWLPPDAGTWLPPNDPARITLARNNANIIRFMYELQAALDLLGENRKIIFEHDENIQYGGLNIIPEYAEFTNRQGVPVTVRRNDLLDYSFNPGTGDTSNLTNWSANPASPGFPRDRYGPVSVDIAGSSMWGAPRPPPFEGTNFTSVGTYMKDHLYGGYGVVRYYCLRSRTDIAEGDRWGWPAFPSNFFGADNRPETYLTKISEMLHGQKTVYIGDDYRRKAPMN